MLIGPGLAKARCRSLVRRRTVPLVSLFRGALASLIEGADVISEGAVRDVGGYQRFYGTTDLCFKVRVPEDRPEVAALVSRDPHARLMAVRVARREALSRIDGALETLTIELSVAEDGAGVRVHLEVEGAVVAKTSRPAVLLP